MKSLQMNIIILFITCLLAVPVVQAEGFLSSLDRHLFLAIHSQNENAVRDALDKGANVNIARRENGDTPLHVVAYYGNVGIARILLAASANVDAKNDVGDTPLHITTGYRGGLNREGQIDVARLILEETDVNIDATNNVGATPLFQAVSRNSRVSDILLEAGANVNIPANNGNTPLGVAINKTARRQGYPYFIWKLLDHGAKVSNLSPSVRNEMFELLRDNPREI